jgi:predicted dehydrogenase
MIDRVRLCIVGCGRVAHRHSKVARSLGGIHLSFASRDKAKAELYRRQHGGVAAYGSYEEACAAKDVDAVFICTPHAYHMEHATLAAGGRKAMLIEKPIARNLAELDRITAAAKQAGVPVMVAENYYFKPAVAVIREHVARGDIGETLLLEINRTNRGAITGWRADAELMGGGALLEGGVHWVNYLVSLAGSDVREVMAAKPTKAYPPVAPFEDTVELVAKFSDGAIGKLLHSWYLRNRLKGVQLSKLYGTDGNIVFETNGIFALVAGKRTRLRVPGLADLMGFRGMLDHFVKVVRDGVNPGMTLAVARRDLAIVEAAYRSLTTGRFERPSS